MFGNGDGMFGDTWLLNWLNLRLDAEMMCSAAYGGWTDPGVSFGSFGCWTVWWFNVTGLR